MRQHVQRPKEGGPSCAVIGKPVLVTGAVSYIRGGDVGIKVNPNTLTYDVLITFANPQDTYNLQQNQTITAKFDFGDIGGCLMPFTGNNGEVRYGPRPRRQAGAGAKSRTASTPAAVRPTDREGIVAGV